MPRRPSPQPGPGSTSYLDRVRWVEVSNENAEDAPGGALLMVTGGGTDDGDSADDYGVPTVDRPDADGLAGLLVAHPAGIPAGGRGLATSDDFVPVAYDDADTPAVGETWGSAAGSWLLTKGMAGWRVAAPATASQDLKLVEAWRDAGGKEWFIAQLKSGVSPYSWQERVETAAGVWADGPRDGTANAYQAQPSVDPPPPPEENDMVMMRASPTVAGAYEFVADGEPCAITPSVRRELIGVYQEKSGGNVTDVYQRFQDITTDANGCKTRGEPYCVVAPESCDTTRDPEYYCVDGVCWAYYDGLAPVAGTGPFATPEECGTGCVDSWWCDSGTCVFVAAGDTPPVGATGPYTTEDGCNVVCVGGEPDCCPETIPALTATLSGGHGTMSLPWDGSYWIGSKALSCGETLHLRYAQTCSALGYSCDGVTWLPCPASLGSILCSPLTDSRVYTCDMNDTLGGCVAGSCGSISVTVAS